MAPGARGVLVTAARSRSGAKVGLATTLARFGVLGALLRLRRRAPIVLRYHRVYPDGTRPFYELGIERALFEAQLDFLRQHFIVVPLAEILAPLRTGRPFPEKRLAITFDDGYRDNLTQAWPALQSRHLPATLFIAVDCVARGEGLWWDRLAAAILAAPPGAPTARLGLDDGGVVTDDPDGRERVFRRVRERWKLLPWDEVRRRLDGVEREWASGAVASELLSWDEVARLSREGCEIGSHTLDHPILSRLPEPEAERQIAGSRRRIEEQLGAPVRHFSYPNGKRGDVTPVVREMVVRAGYEGAVSTIEGRVGRDSDPFMLERKGATRGASSDSAGRFSPALFAAELSGLYDLIFQRRQRDRGIH
jgi:peptidoglycan/xylan/chitin deacetylase (PgdA/CDA1 family)